ncbi:hypothetical protein HanPI659440_Chr16g0619711 [Helianthus annuus]|nr:hypothetical protein HanPI659440_Chr16g0619711 [Helianthus annuus]
MMKENMMFEHKHPFSLIDLWSEQLQREEESEEDEEEKDDVLNAKQDFKCSCSRCGEDINWYHRSLGILELGNLLFGIAGVVMGRQEGFI